MAASVVKSHEVYLDGGELSCFFTSWRTSHEQQEVESTFLCSDGDRSFLPGLKSASLDCEGAFDYDTTDSDAVNDILSTAFNNQTELVVSIADATAAGGGLAVMGDGPITNYTVESPLGQITNANFSMRNDGNIYYGEWIDAKMDLDTETLNSSSLDNSASSSNGGIFHAHLILESDSDATSGGTSITLQHSANDSTWADLVASQSFSGFHDGVSSLVAASTTVNRYLRFQCTSDGVAHVVACFIRL